MRRPRSRWLRLRLRLLGSWSFISVRKVGRLLVALALPLALALALVSLVVARGCSGLLGVNININKNQNQTHRDRKLPRVRLGNYVLGDLGG